MRVLQQLSGCSFSSISATFAAADLLVAAGAVSAQDAAPPQVRPDLAHYPAFTLETKALKLRGYLPDAEKGYYRGTRFDWSGLVSTVAAGGHVYFCEFRPGHDPLNHDDICGTAEEFGIDANASYDEAAPGGTFVKIGVGLLERADNSPYAFWKQYKIIKAGEWKVTRQAGSAEFSQNFKGDRGWAYDYRKTLQLSTDEPVLTISRRLKNTGSKPIKTHHYGHNFIKIDDVPAGPEYRIEFPFAPNFGENSQPHGCLELKDNSMVFLKEVPAKGAVWVKLDGFSKPDHNSLKIVNRKTGAAMSIVTSLPPLRMVYYSSDGVLAPEPFAAIDLAPGEEKEWKTTYRFEPAR